jgi:hypothetical protein
VIFPQIEELNREVEELSRQVRAATNGYGFDARPHIQLDHIDGPLLLLRDGRLHWLTLAERILLWLGRTDAAQLERKHWRTA